MSQSFTRALSRAWAQLGLSIVLLLGLGAAQQAHAAACKVLVLTGDVTVSDMIQDGYDVVYNHVPYSEALSGPNANLGQYSLLWFGQPGVNWYPPGSLTAADASAVKNYLATGGAVHFNGEYPEGQISLSWMYRDWMLSIMNGSVRPGAGGGTIGYADKMQGGPWNISPVVAGNVNSAPYALPSVMSFDNGGALTGNIPARNRVAYQGNLATMTGVSNTVAFDGSDMVSGKGRISFFGDAGNLAQSSVPGPLMKNLYTFLADPAVCRANVLAVNDLASVFAQGGQAITNVLANDDMNPGGLHGQVVPKIGTVVTLSEVPGTNTSPAAHPITLNTSTGAVDVPANTPPGTYSLQYQFCQISHPSNCTTAKATVTVNGPPVPPVPQQPVAVPTLSAWSLLLLALTAGATGWRRLRR